MTHRVESLKRSAARLLAGATLLAAALAVLSPPAGGAPAGPIVAVLSSDAGPYREALAGLEQEWGGPIPSFIMSEGDPNIPESARVVVAFGAKAAFFAESGHRTLIYALTLGTEVSAPAAVKICMEPEPAALLADLKTIDPWLKNLGILWLSPSAGLYADELREASVPYGVTIHDIQIEDIDEIPAHLRGLYGKIDALWISPDPTLLNANILPVFLSFSRANAIPLFVPTAGLLGQGAAASVAPSFREMGRSAGVAARAALQGQPQESRLYPSRIEIVINKKAAADAGLEVPEDALLKATKVLP